MEPLSAAVLAHISAELGVSLKSLSATISLLDEGAAVPFIARYRKEVTGNLDEVQIRSIQEKLEYFRELEDRRRTVLRSIEEQGQLTPELRARILAVLDRNELEDLYLPFKPKRRTKASIAREKGLEPLARYLWEQKITGVPLGRFAATFVNAEKEVPSADEALAGARHIVAEWIAENAELRKGIRRMMTDHGMVASRAIEGVEDPERKYHMYADYREPVSRIPSHRMLAVRRGAKEGFLTFEIQMEAAPPVAWLTNRVLRTRGDWTPHLEQAVADSYERLLNPSIQTEVRLELKDRSDEEAIRVFRENLENLLLAAPAGMMGVLAIDPGHSHRMQAGGSRRYRQVPGKRRHLSARAAQGPGRGHAKPVRIDRPPPCARPRDRQWNRLARGVGVRAGLSAAGGVGQVFSVVVSEAGASVYSASDIARQEFPDLDLTIRGAISIARRLQDPLAELVKIDPKAIGVGQYQHDVDQRKLLQGLEATVESCVNRVGVDLNTASFALLRHVAGIKERAAEKIVEYRNKHGRFRSRVEVMAVSGFGPKTFEQAAGFLRIRGGENPLDMTAVHPESYEVVETHRAIAGRRMPDLIGRPELLDSVKLEAFRTATVGDYTLADIREELRRPGRDPRDKFAAPEWRDDVKDIADLKIGMLLEGVVTNVTNFGAFVDVGVHHDGLVHVSELANRFVKDPHEVVKAGQVVRVQVMSADAKTRRIALSMRAASVVRPKS